MNLITIFSKFPDQEACIEYLERVRWIDTPFCPLCGGTKVARKAEGERVGRWNCRVCNASFNVLSGTIFEKTRLPLQKWFLAIGVIVNAKKSVSSCQLARDLDLNQKSAWYMQQRIRAAMLTEEGVLMQGVIEADETHVGGKPHKGKRRDKETPAPRGRATEKIPAVGAVERGARVVAPIANGFTGKGLLRLLKSVSGLNGSVLMTNELSAYNEVGKAFRRSVINHCHAYADGQTHTNSIEGFWLLVKRAWFGSRHHYSKSYMPLFVGEASWKCNQRRNVDPFATFIKECFA